MTEIAIKIVNQVLQLPDPRPRLVAGSVGVYAVTLDYDAQWDNAPVRVVVFDGGLCNKRISVQDTTGTVTIPPECIAHGAHGNWLQIGVLGFDGTGKLRITTRAMRDGLRIDPAGVSDSDVPQDPPTATPGLWEQLVTDIGNLSDLQTVDKSSLVAAINEVWSSGGSGGSSVTDAAINEDGHLIITLSSGEEIDAGYAVGPAGATGPQGPQGKQGPQGPAGPAGADGKDGAGMDITGAQVGQIAKITAVDTDGKPTTWEAVDMGGGGETWELINEVTLSEDAMAVVFDKDKSGAAFALRKFVVVGTTKGSDASNTDGGIICINVANTPDDHYSIVPPVPKHGALKGDKLRYWHAAAEILAEKGWRWYLTGADNTWEIGNVTIATSLMKVSRIIPKVATYLAVWSRTSGSAFAAGSNIELYGVRA